MPSQDPAQWFNDLSVRIDEQELIAEANVLGPQLLLGGSRVGAAVWISLVAIVAGAFGGFTFSDEVRSSWAGFVGYLVGGTLCLRGLRPLTRRLVSPSVEW